MLMSSEKYFFLYIYVIIHNNVISQREIFIYILTKASNSFSFFVEVLLGIIMSSNKICFFLRRLIIATFLDNLCFCLIYISLKSSD